MSNFEERVLEVVEPHLREIRRLFQGDEPQARGGEVQDNLLNLVRDLKFELIDLREVIIPVLDELRDKDQNEEDPKENGRDVKPSEVIQRTLPTRHQIQEVVRSLGDLYEKLGDDDEMMQRLARTADSLIPVAELGRDVMSEWRQAKSEAQLDDIATRLRLIERNVVSPVLNDATWFAIDKTAKVAETILDKLSDCCTTTQSKLDSLLDKVSGLSNKLNDCCNQMSEGLSNLSDSVGNANGKLDTIQNKTSQIMSKQEVQNLVGSAKDDVMSFIALSPS